ncbi:hypothetical protein IWX90DRAFT_412042 [Phyllosticta citrichinensis]|uniref:Uncharacterized protein n=1 Tax=Phyllosticta citrichinensis TaxID=1130410 RepID=A0ABR1Y2W6_9PEZI
MPLTQILHRLREQDQQRDSFVASDAASTSKSLPGAASNSENSTPPNITTNTNNGHEQRRTTTAPTTKHKPDLNKPLPPLPTNQSDMETSDVDSNEENSNKSSSKTSTKTASAPSIPSKASSTTLLSNDNHHRHDISDASIAAVLVKLTEDDQKIIIRARNSVRLDPLNNPVAPADQRKTAGVEGRSSLWPKSAVDKEKKEKERKTKPMWLRRWPWKRSSASGKRSRGRTSSARDSAPSSSSCSRCPPPATIAAGHTSEDKTAPHTGSNLPIGGSATAAKILRNTTRAKGERSRQTQKETLKEQALRQMRARTKGETQTQTLGTRALKTRERSPKAMDSSSGMEMNFLLPTL